MPTGYSFNLDGTNIYMTLATLLSRNARLRPYLRPATDHPSGGDADVEGASGITGSGFITLAATLAVVDPRLVPGMAILLGIDTFIIECHALTNLCGNGVACVAGERIRS